MSGTGILLVGNVRYGAIRRAERGGDGRHIGGHIGGVSAVGIDAAVDLRKPLAPGAVKQPC
jgi:hypothetical protein